MLGFLDLRQNVFILPALAVQAQIFELLSWSPELMGHPSFLGVIQNICSRNSLFVFGLLAILYVLDYGLVRIFA